MKVRSAPAAVNFVWTEPPESQGRVGDTADPLGFRAAAVRVARRLVPCLTQSSFRVRGFGLACFGLDAARRVPALPDPVIDDAYLRFERLVVYAQCWHYPDGLPAAVRYSGSQRAYARLRSHPDLDLNLPLLLHDDLSGGLWGAYRRPALHLGLLRPLGNRSKPAATGLTRLGDELAGAVEGSVVANPSRTRKLVRDRTRWTTGELAADLAPADTGTSTSQEVDILSRTLAAFDDQRAERGRGRPFTKLRTAFDADNGTLTLNRINRSVLTEGQAQALDDARALAALMVAVEQPYRRWVTGGRATLAKSVAQDRAWSLVRVMGEPDLCRLLADLSVDPTLDTVHRHQQRLAAERGREPWELDASRPGREELVDADFTLGTAAALFTDGIDPDRGPGA